MKGIIVRWFDEKGFGFIKSNEANNDIFVHISKFEKGYRRPQIGDNVEFKLVSSGSRLSAEKVSLIGVQPQKSSSSLISSVISLVFFCVLGLFIYDFVSEKIAILHNDVGFTSQEKTYNSSTDSIIESAYKNKRSHVQVNGSGNVIRLLSDDNKGSRHQKFILRLSSGQTLLIAHNIDLAPRINSLSNGDYVEFYGEYAWNNQGGVVHWTHRDPHEHHVGGWLKHNGRTYQ